LARENRSNRIGFRPHIWRVLVEISAAAGQQKRHAKNDKFLSHCRQIPLGGFTCR
jgi:hypothetical protein